MHVTINLGIYLAKSIKVFLSHRQVKFSSLIKEISLYSIYQYRKLQSRKNGEKWIPELRVMNTSRTQFIQLNVRDNCKIRGAKIVMTI